KAGKILLAEDSDFFRNQVKNFIQEEGYAVLAAPDGLKAWKLLEKHPDEITLVVTDIEMPNMDGFELAGRIRKDARFAGLPIIAVTSLASEKDMARGRDAGISDYQVKLDREKLMASVRQFLDGE
ncbi:MAG: response regulator, partial [Pseudomonadota bacterium]